MVFLDGGGFDVPFDSPGLKITSYFVLLVRLPFDNVQQHELQTLITRGTFPENKKKKQCKTLKQYGKYAQKSPTPFCNCFRLYRQELLVRGEVRFRIDSFHSTAVRVLKSYPVRFIFESLSLDQIFSVNTTLFGAGNLVSPFRKNRKLKDDRAPLYGDTWIHQRCLLSPESLLARGEAGPGMALMGMVKSMIELVGRDDATLL